jgi:hypothetical protein
MELHLLKGEDTRRGKDLVDIRFLLDYNADVITEDRLRAICDRFGGPGAYQKIRAI